MIEIKQQNVGLYANLHLRELQLHRVSRAMFDLIPGMMHEYPATDRHATFWTKSTTIGLGRKKLLLIVFCTEPPFAEPSLAEPSLAEPPLADQEKAGA